MKKKTMPFKKKGKKKKKGASSRPLSYDEAIEAKVQMFSDEDFTLETDFNEVF